jgi:general stress protein 26
MVKTAQQGDATQQRLWEAIETRRIGMLGLTKSGLHAQPMLAFVERRRKRLWFIARTDTELAQSIGDGGCCAFMFQDGDLVASIGGALSLVDDRRRMARCWNAAVAAWLPEGLHDPKLTMLRMDCVDAEVWIAGHGLTKFAWEVAWGSAPLQMLEMTGRAQATLH